MSYVEHEEEYKGYTIEIRAEEGAPEPDFSFLGRFLFLGGRDYINLIDDHVDTDFDHAVGYYRELIDNDLWNGNCWEEEMYSLEAELRRKRYEFREVWRSGYDGSWSWGPPNTLRECTKNYCAAGWVEGIIYVTPDQIREEWGHKIATAQDRAKAQRVLEGELEVWAHWASGEVYYWTVEGDGLDDSCGGFYEDYWDYGKGEPLYPILSAREAVDDYLANKEAEQLATIAEFAANIA